MRVNLRKLRQLIIFFAHHAAVKPLGKVKLFKLLYFTDVTHIRIVGVSITGEEYLKFPFGPVPTHGDFVLKDLQLRRIIRQKRISLPNARFMREFTARQEPDMAIFADQERETISLVIQEYGEDPASVLSWRSHQEYAWLFAKERRPLQLTPEQQPESSAQKNAAAIALLDEWYATPDDRPSGYWDELIKDIEKNRLRFRDEDIEL
jgi:uncharacterized phage-associated protein